MAVQSSMLPLGTPLPSFRLTDTVSGRSVAAGDFGGRPLVVAFICNHCPYVKRIRDGLAAFGRFASERQVGFVGISSNDPAAYPDDAPDKMALEARDAGWTFPYLFDDTQETARSFQAACTPEFYVFDAAGKLAYRGQFDEARPKNDAPVTGADVRAAVEALLAGRAPASEQKPSIGCSIKWKAA
ncbi:MAG TPA: thioredoxin family protein [Polyangiaceae bacterium]|jgi:thiol-disulfide isomerase/thioredoxin|nr:thioredoxin family protein [Polyangiaceae bacterium]